MGVGLRGGGFHPLSSGSIKDEGVEFPENRDFSEFSV